jgi:membrane-associated PAP2 superfamily phosphatase
MLSLIGLNLDLAIAGLFFDETTRRFPAASNPYLAMLRDHGLIAVTTCVVCVGLAMLRLLPWRLPSLSPRVAGFLALSLVLGPGLLANGILKPHWGRPRPIEVTQFGGDLTFVEWWNPTGACQANCSFISGEASTAAWMFGPAMLVPEPWRALAIGAAAAFTIVTSGARIAVGGHFFSDALFGALATILILLVMQKLFTRTAAADGSPRAPSAGQGVGTSA